MLSIAVIGGGAAGFMAAITAKGQMPNANVCIFEKGKKEGKRTPKAGIRKHIAR